MRNFFLYLIPCLFLFACKTQQRAIQNYVEDMQDTTLRKAYYIAEPVIQKNDLLSIYIYSKALNNDVDELYNLHMGRVTGVSAMGQGQGYLVDQHGNIEMPRIGVLHAEGLTKNALADSIKIRLDGQLIDPSVIIRFMNFRIIIIGEVRSPGVKSVNVENLTLLEALALGGDVTEFGKKKEIKVLRENNRQRQVGIVDVTSSKMFESPYYQLQQNDVIMVEANRYKERRTEQQRITQQVGFALSIITSITLLYNIFSR